MSVYVINLFFSSVMVIEIELMCLKNFFLKAYLQNKLNQMEEEMHVLKQEKYDAISTHSNELQEFGDKLLKKLGDLEQKVLRLGKEKVKRFFSFRLFYLFFKTLNLRNQPMI
jgi:transcriptional regulator of heat shock response